MSLRPSPHRDARFPLVGTGVPGLLLGASLLASPPAFSQDIRGGVVPAHVAIVDGESVLDRDLERGPAAVGMPVVPGDRIRTNRGRLEIVFPDGTALDIDEFTVVDLQSDALVRLTEGRVRLSIPRDAVARLQVDTPAATVRPEGPGDLRVAVTGSTYSQTELSVARGIAEFRGDRGAAIVAAGERSVAWPDDAPSRPERFNSARLDAFDRWALDQLAFRTGGRSAQYLPQDLRAFGGTLDEYGAWDYDASYGYVWYPSVDSSWRPYYRGYWSSVPHYGWTWIGLEQWAWPTHHYGRWGHAGSRWFWIPERQWAPAWVSWGAAPGYVSWCPLGFDNRPVFALSVSVGATWNGWVVQPRERFGVRGDYVHRTAVSPRASTSHAPFVQQSAPPLSPSRSPSRRIIGADRPQDLTAPPNGERARARSQIPPAGPEGSSPPVGREPSVSRATRPDARASTQPGNGRIEPAQPGVPGPDQRGAYGAPFPQSPAQAARVPAQTDANSNRGMTRAPRNDNTVQQPAPRSYPFGEVRRRNAPVATPSPNTGAASSRESRVGPRDRSSVPPSVQTPPQPREVIVPPPPPAEFSPDRTRRSEAPATAGTTDNSGGSAVSRAPRFGSSAPAPPATGRGGERPSGGDARPRGDGRTHEPASRRPQ